MLKQFQIFLGPARLRALILLFGLTGLISLILNAVAAPWVTTAQTVLLAIFVLGSAIIIAGRMRNEERLRWLAILAPVVGAVILGVVVVPDLLLPLLGASVGWIIAGMFLFRQRTPGEYHTAIRALRKGEYETAVYSMDDLIKAYPEEMNYYRLRAEVFRLWGKLDRARRDYQTMTELAPDSAIAFNGLAEVHLQSGRHVEAHAAAERAYALAPDEWVAAYNLGMIEDRLGQATEAIEHLQQALMLKVPDARHRLLIYLYLARAYHNLGQAEDAQTAIDNLRRHRGGLDEWHNLLVHEQAATLRAVLAEDVALAQTLVDGSTDMTILDYSI